MTGLHLSLVEEAEAVLQAPLLHSLLVVSFGDGYNQITGSNNQPRGALCTLGTHAIEGKSVDLDLFTLILCAFADMHYSSSSSSCSTVSSKFPSS